MRCSRDREPGVQPFVDIQSSGPETLPQNAVVMWAAGRHLAKT